MTRLLSLFGLMRVSEHEELTRLKTAALDTIAQSYCGEVKAATDWQAKYKQAVAMNKKLTESMAFIERDRDHWRDQALRDEPDALAMRRKRQRDRDRRKGRG